MRGEKGTYEGRSRILFYPTVFSPAGERIQEAIESFVPRNMLEIHLTLGSFTNRLRQPTDTVLFCVIFAPHRKDLESLLPIRQLMRKIKIVLVISDSDSETIALAHNIRPRYLAYSQMDMSGVGAVLSKMVGNAMSGSY